MTFAEGFGFMGGGLGGSILVQIIQWTAKVETNFSKLKFLTHFVQCYTFISRDSN